jgi:hypothetical protein
MTLGTLLSNASSDNYSISTYSLISDIFNGHHLTMYSLSLLIDY